MAADVEPDLPAPARYMLVELDDFTTPWELASMSYEMYLDDERFVAGPGALVDARERPQMAQDAAAELLRRGLIEVRRGRDWSDDGQSSAVDATEAAALLSDPITWQWPERDVYAWFVLTAAGVEAAQAVSLDDVPRLRLPSRRLLARVRERLANAPLPSLLRLLERGSPKDRSRRTR